MNLKEFSNFLGLSPTTVSRALSGYPEVSEKTRRKVNEAARIHGYQPNLRARALALGRSYSIGHVLSSSNGNELVNPIFGVFISGAAEAGAARGYSINLTIAGQSSEESVFRKLKAQGSVAGIILQSPRVHDERIELLKELGLKFVVHGRSSGVSIPYSWVDVNNHRAFEHATTFLAHMGHRRIGLINGRQDFDFAHRRLNGYLQALHAAGIEPHSELQSSGDMTEANGYAAAKAMLELENPATAFLAASANPAGSEEAYSTPRELLTSKFRPARSTPASTEARSDPSCAPTPGSRMGASGAMARTSASSLGYVAPTTSPTLPFGSHSTARRASA